MPLDRSAFTGSRVLQPVWKLKPRYVEPMFNPRHSHGINLKKPLSLNSLVLLFVVFLAFRKKIYLAIIQSFFNIKVP